MPQIKILLTCSSGLTTSYFAYKLNEAAKLLNINYSLDAIDYNNLYNVAYKYDIILLAPQISYTYNKTKEILKNKLVLNIPPKIFAQYDIKKTFIFIQDALNQTKKICRYFPQQIKTISKIHIDQTTLILSLFEQDYKIYILYRLYNNDKQIILDNKIIKPTYNIQDIFDIIDTCILKYPNIEQIGISMSNFNHYKKINSSCLQDVNHKNLIKILKSRYPLKIFVNNDVNAAALGYYTTHNQYSSLAFLIQPIDSYARTGLIINKKLY